ncbi:hypothetical protein SJ05684_c04510 [Sinorhizobium sojae CCBAU 05684]|uniref:Uncharacterized protein n=1 Tax=Sinorhizobium sojae CCBAU 05684 TaxID=716928 RepID=A0A249P882_9HYPH|nr:hypothetical protein SJ05684_c04510 [Sinorhizobium sojae CCBAU 05684]
MKALPELKRHEGAGVPHAPRLLPAHRIGCRPACIPGNGDWAAIGG